MSGASCRFAYGPINSTLTVSCFFSSRVIAFVFTAQCFGSSDWQCLKCSRKVARVSQQSETARHCNLQDSEVWGGGVVLSINQSIPTGRGSGEGEQCSLPNLF